MRRRVRIGLTAPGQLFWLATLIGVSALSYVLNYTFQKIAGPVVFSQIGYWGTGFGVVLAAMLFGDVLQITSLLGVVAIIVGGVVVNRRSPDRKVEPQQMQSLERECSEQVSARPA